MHPGGRRVQAARKLRAGRSHAGPKMVSGLLSSKMTFFKEARRGLEASGRGADEMFPPAGALAVVKDRLERWGRAQKALRSASQN